MSAAAPLRAARPAGSLEAWFAPFRAQVIGHDLHDPRVQGAGRVVYADWTASGRLYRSQWIERWGKEVALRLDAEIREGFQTFKDLVAEFPECEPQPGGHLYIAHRDKKLDFLRNETRIMREVFGYDARMLSPEEVRREVARAADRPAPAAFGQRDAREQTRPVAVVATTDDGEPAPSQAPSCGPKGWRRTRSAS